jgi:hypothetical protein
MTRTLEDFGADDPFQDSERKVPNGPDPIHNRCFTSLYFFCALHCSFSLFFGLVFFISSVSSRSCDSVEFAYTVVS